LSREDKEINSNTDDKTGNISTNHKTIAQDTHIKKTDHSHSVNGLSLTKDHVHVISDQSDDVTNSDPACISSNDNKLKDYGNIPVSLIDSQCQHQLPGAVTSQQPINNDNHTTAEYYRSTTDELKVI